MIGGFHTHNFGGHTTINDNHRHSYGRQTSPEANVPGHVHSMIDITTLVDGHRHRISVKTGPSISTGNGHTHRYSGTTSFDDGHVHYFKGYTSRYPN
ncbi:MAG: hypothetical protein GX339_10570 [Tissierellia bacterium]|nr:hypothetical protein [Tissierellia bacterium]